MADPVCILMYHSVGGPEGVYDVAPGRFGEHLRALDDVGARVLDLDAVVAGGGTAGDGPGVVLTFDDGDATVATRAAPALAQRGWGACVYAVSEWTGRPGFLDRAALRDLAEGGWTVGSHGATHRFLSGLDGPELAGELRESRAHLAEVTGRPVRHAALPGGRGGAREAAAARDAGYVSLATSEVGRHRTGGDPFALPRVAVQRDTDARTLVRAVTGAASFYARIRARRGVLGAAKRLLGDERYHRLWQRLHREAS